MKESNIPDWNILLSFGMPLARNNEISHKYNKDDFEINILSGISYFALKNPRKSDRLNDAFKALLLSLKTHYPSLFISIINKSKFDVENIFKLDTVSGKDIKLRNICLSILSQKLNGNNN